jgi:hypothetical protein
MLTHAEFQGAEDRLEIQLRTYEPHHQLWVGHGLNVLDERSRQRATKLGPTQRPERRPEVLDMVERRNRVEVGGRHGWRSGYDMKDSVRSAKIGMALLTSRTSGQNPLGLSR